MFKGINADYMVFDEALTGADQRKVRYRESNNRKKERDLDRRKKRADKRRQAY